MTTKLLNEQVAGQVRQIFEQMQAPVKVLFFGKKDAGGREVCEYCDDTLQLAQEVVNLSDKLGLEMYDLDQDASVAQQYHVERAPGLVIAGRDGDRLVDYGVRLSGIPAGHEFSALIHTLVLVSSRDSGLDQQTRQSLQNLKKPVHLQVFVTPT